MQKNLDLTSTIKEKIIEIRGLKVIVDRDLSELYGVQTKVLKQAVKRNIERFPSDFMFQMTDQEFENWRSQFVTSNSSIKMGLRYRPFCFTEQGVAMLSSVLSSRTAVMMNIHILRVFTKLKEMLLLQKDILVKLQQIENVVSSHDQDIAELFEAMRQMITKPNPPRERIGFKP